MLFFIITFNIILIELIFIPAIRTQKKGLIKNHFSKNQDVYFVAKNENKERIYIKVDNNGNVVKLNENFSKALGTGATAKVFGGQEKDKKIAFKHVTTKQQQNLEQMLNSDMAKRPKIDTVVKVLGEISM